MMTPVDFTKFPPPGSTVLFALDSIMIKGVTLPLDGLPEGGTSLVVEKKKADGSDFSTYTSHGLEGDPVRIRIQLWVDQATGKDWFAQFDKVRSALIQKTLSKRNAIPVYHPFLAAEGIDSIIFTKRSLPVRLRGLIFAVQLEGLDARTARIGSGGSASKKVEQDKQLQTRATAAKRQGPAAAQRGKAAK